MAHDRHKKRVDLFLLNFAEGGGVPPSKKERDFYLRAFHRLAGQG